VCSGLALRVLRACYKRSPDTHKTMSTWTCMHMVFHGAPLVHVTEESRKMRMHMHPLWSVQCIHSKVSANMGKLFTIFCSACLIMLAGAPGKGGRQVHNNGCLGTRRVKAFTKSACPPLKAQRQVRCLHQIIKCVMLEEIAQGKIFAQTLKPIR
jgi:hypothetical protein